MSKSTKRKHVVKEVLDDYYLPEGNEAIVRIVGGRGNNLHEVEDDEGKKYLVSMPTKFRKNVWIKRGDFVVVEPIEEGDKVKAEIVCVLYKEQIRYIKQEGKWPSGFEERPAEQAQGEEDDLFQNTNRPVVEISESDTESESDEESEEECSDKE